MSKTRTPVSEDILANANETLSFVAPGVTLKPMSEKTFIQIMASYLTPEQVEAIMAGKRVLPAQGDPETTVRIQHFAPAIHSDATMRGFDFVNPRSFESCDHYDREVEWKMQANQS